MYFALLLLMRLRIVLRNWNYRKSLVSRNTSVSHFHFIFSVTYIDISIAY